MSTQALLRFSPTHLPEPRGVVLDFLAPAAGFSRAQQIRLDRRAGEKAALAVARKQLGKALDRIPGFAAVEIGSPDCAAEPYPEEERFRPLLRPLLESLLDAEGLQILLCSRSPLLLRDLDVLRELDHRHSVTVRVPLSTLDPCLARTLEGAAPLPQARLRIVEQAAAAGLAAEIAYGPILPEINDGERMLRALFEGARAAGARDVIAQRFVLRATARRGFFHWLELEFPELAARYRGLLDLRGRWPATEIERQRSKFRRLRLENRFPRPLPGRG